MDILDISLDDVPMSENLDDFHKEFLSMDIIGEGGFGKVRKAIRCSDKQKVAIKYISNSKITSWHRYSKTNKFIPMEIALMCRCREISGVIKIIKYFHIKEHKGWYIVMQRFDNHIDLFDHITNMSQISEKDALHFMNQLVTILINCHKLGVCHRDIKDENIIIDLSTKKIYLIDFGAGGILHDNLYSEFDGTRVYSPPEWIQYKRYHAPSLETWSLGILLYDMVCGNLPFDNDDSIINSFPIFRKSISRSCQELIIKCLDKDPENRPTFKEILNHHWFSCYSKFSHYELPKSTSQPEYSSHSISPNMKQLKTSIPTYSSAIESNTRRMSGETSPFVTPQSSGVEDTHTTNDSSSIEHISNQKHFFDNSEIRNPCRNFNSKYLFNHFDFNSSS